MDMPELVVKAKEAGRKLKCYKRDYYWLDIGRPQDYDKAAEVFRRKRKVFMPK